MLLDPKATKPRFRNAHTRGSRTTVASVSIAQLPFWFLCSSLFFLDPPENAFAALVSFSIHPLQNPDYRDVPHTDPCKGNHRANVK